MRKGRGTVAWEDGIEDGGGTMVELAREGESSDCSTILVFARPGEGKNMAISACARGPLCCALDTRAVFVAPEHANLLQAGEKGEGRKRVRAQFEMHCAAATAPLPDEFRGPILLIGELVVSTWAEMRRSRLGGLGAGSWLEGGKHRGTGSEKYGPRVASIFWMFRHEGVVRRLREWEAPFEVFATRTVRPQRRTQVRRRRDVSAMRACGLVQRWRGSRGMGRRGSRGVGWRICVPVDLACPRAVAAVSACEAGSRGRRQRCVVWTWTADERACRPSVMPRCCCAFRVCGWIAWTRAAVHGAETAMFEGTGMAAFEGTGTVDVGARQRTIPGCRCCAFRM
ncbi:hypothetical protein BKA93DRAFT_747791 [Sparassis latifolia]